jgi:hypothetical protein
LSKTELAREIVREYIDLGVKHNKGYSKRFIAMVLQSNMKKTITGKFYGSWAVGCLCNLYPQYNPSNNWNNGFAIVDNKMIIDGKIY